ncbi:unnamed protein product [Ceratitis capitata]|uniref:(Mediterranean fruit fly) hypothetical protein n=1 Tax=Ceratitis capitata TaxID=7213 RepID=A0A811UKH2_CERCA|nr:unnamed protein product [Ceratitis capitata]
MNTACEYSLSYNFISISVLDGNEGFRIFAIEDYDKVEEIFARDSENYSLIERQFNTSLVVLVPADKPNCLLMMNYKKNQRICNCVYATKVISVRLNRQRLIAVLEESIHIHDISNMEELHVIGNLAPNPLGLCTLSYNSDLAFPISNTTGELRIFNSLKLTEGITIEAHKSRLSAMHFTPSGNLLATTSERGTVIRVFCAKNGQRIQEFRRGVKRCVRIASLVFSLNGRFLCVTSNTETVHIFKVDMLAASKAIEEAEEAERMEKLETEETTAEKTVATISDTAVAGTSPSDVNSGWSDYISKAVSTYLLPTQVSDVLAQDRAFATVTLQQPGMRYVCGMTYLGKEMKVLIASEDGFLYIHEFDALRGGICELVAVHDLRGVLDGVVEVNISDNGDKMSPGSSNKEPNGSRNLSTKNCNRSSANAASSSRSTTKSSSSTSTSNKKNCGISRCIIQNPVPEPDNSYAGIVKGPQAANPLTADSAKHRLLCDAIETPIKLFDERQFPPVAIAARD